MKLTSIICLSTENYKLIHSTTADDVTIFAHASGGGSDIPYVDIGKLKVEGKIKYRSGTPWLFEHKHQKLSQHVANNFQDFLKICAIYQDLVFCMSRKEVFERAEYVFISLPPEYSKTLDPCIENVLQVLSEELVGVVINNFNSLDQMELLNLDVEEVAKTLKIGTIGKHHTRFIWFHPNGYIVNVRICLEEDVTSLEKELTNSREDLKLLKFFFNDDLKNKNIFMTFLVIATNISKNELNQFCIQCRDNIVPKEDFVQGNALDSILRHIERCNTHPPSRGTVIPVFKCVISQLLASISSADDKSRPYLPLLRGNPRRSFSIVNFKPTPTRRCA